jgi:hypothetical protein
MKKHGDFMKALIAITTILFTSIASAGLLIEPQVGYVLSNKFTGTNALTGTASGNGDYKTNGPEYGARLGFQFVGLMTGLNYSHVSGTAKNSSGTSGDYKANNVGLFVGFNAPILVRGWIAYNFSSKADIGSGTAKGKSTEFGVGFTGLPFLSVNAIYRMYDFDDVTAGGKTYTGFKPNEVELAVSAPFNLF